MSLKKLVNISKNISNVNSVFNNIYILRHMQVFWTGVVYVRDSCKVGVLLDQNEQKFFLRNKV
jgi:hypothetical protein